MTAYEYEAEEYRSAMRYTTTTPCYTHNHRPDGVGGLTCTICGDTINEDEV